MVSTAWIIVHACVAAILSPSKVLSVSLRGGVAGRRKGKSHRQESSVSVYDAFSSAVDPSIEALLNGGSANLNQAVKDGAAALDLKTALANTKIPDEVRKLLSAVGVEPNKNQQVQDMGAQQVVNFADPAPAGQAPEGTLIKEMPVKSTVDFDKDAVDKGVKMLNKMVAASQVNLDAKTIECQEFDESNRKTAFQVRTDLAEIGVMITTLNSKKSSIMANQQSADEDARKVQESQGKAEFDYKQKYETDNAMLGIHKADLAVAEFMLEMSKCKDADYKASMLQATNTMKTTAIETCLENGTASFKFMDSRLETSKSRLTAHAQQLLNFALAKSRLLGSTVGSDKVEDYALRAAGLAYGEGLEDLDDGDEPFEAKLNLAEVAMTRKQQPPIPPKPPMPPGSIEEATSSEEQAKVAKRCAKADPDCGLLHDTFANLWGDMKDLVEALEDKMKKEADAWNDLNTGFNTQLSTNTLYKGQLQTSLSEVSAAIKEETSAQTQKDAELKQLDAIWEETTAECKAAVKELLYTEICGTITVRNELLVAGLQMKHDEILDCEFTGWVSAGCSVECDDNMVGGIESLSREIIQAPTTYGAACPILNYTKKCNQFKCPVACQLSEFEGWSKCSAECGGGTQSQSRTIEVRPKNAGKACDVLEESRVCNTFSCDLDCELSPWSPFTACSKACGTGFRMKEKLVTREKRADGICWADTDPERYVREDCNTQACVGDEICVAKMDVVIAIDGSGSLTEAGFAVLQEFTVELVKKLRGEAYGAGATRVSIVQFGNGHLDAQNVVSAAHMIKELSYDMEETKKAIEGLKWQKGFTNMAQALIAAKSVLKTTKRTGAHSLALVITDGQPSFKRQTEEAASKLREISTLMMVQIKAVQNEENADFLKSKIVSQPWDTNFMYIPGKKALKSAYDKFASEALVLACPEAESPSLIATANEAQGFVLKAAGMVCVGAPADKSNQASPEACKAKAEGLNWDTFAFKPDSFYEGTGDCLVFTKPCSEYEENIDFNTYGKLASGETSNSTKPEE